VDTENDMSETLTILVSGANGFVGRHCVHRLLREGYRVLATDLNEQLAPWKAGDAEQVEYLAGDLSKPSLHAILREHHRFDAAIHLAGLLPKADTAENNRLILEVNVGGTLEMLETCKVHGARILFASSAMVYGDQPAPYHEALEPRPGNMYGLTKLMGEQLVMQYYQRSAIPWTVFRPGVLYGAGQGGGQFVPSMITQMLRGNDFPMTRGEQKRDFIYVDDFIDLMIAALRSPREGIFNVGGGQPVTMIEAARMIEELTGTSDTVKVGALPYREHELWEYSLDISKSEQIFNWRPVTRLRDGLRKAVTHAKETAQ
jgi:UDP-glucose 4-epimerase